MSHSDRIRPTGVDVGSSQPTRAPPALDPSFAPLDGRTREELAGVARAFAEKLAFWRRDNQFDPDVDWAEFFPDVPDIESEGSRALLWTRPQALLFAAFLRLYRHVQADLNALTAQHMDFYYRKVLRLAEKSPVPDHAHLVLGLKKTANDVRIPAGTTFTTGRGLPYATSEEIFLHQTKVVFLRTLHRDPDSGVLRYAAVSNSGDGLGAELPEGDPSWHPFGYARALPLATTGFAVSSPILVLREGRRIIDLTLTLRFGGGAPDNAALETLLSQHLNADVSGEKAWLTLGRTTAVSITELDPTTRSVKLEFELKSQDPPAVPYDPTTLEGGYDTLAPVLRVTIRGDAPSLIAAALSEAVVLGIGIRVTVTGMKNLVLENDHGKLDPAKPFLPFGPVPTAGSSFYVGADEALSKKVDKATLRIVWNKAPAPPADFGTHYAGYTDHSGRTIANNGYFKADFEILRGGRFETLNHDVSLFDATDATKEVQIRSVAGTDGLLDAGYLPYKRFAQRFSRSVSTIKIRLPFSDAVVSRPLATLRAAPALAFRAPVERPTLQQAPRLSASLRDGFLRLRLRSGFLHDRYPEVFARAFSTSATPPPPTPNAPYTPEIASFELDYEASTDTVNPSSNVAAEFSARNIRLFHVTPFGQREEHLYIKEQLATERRAVTLLSARDTEGELLIGLSGLEPKRSVSLLLQVRDGSADPTAQPAPIRWSVLCSNHWQTLSEGQILADHTRNLLASGTVRVVLPPETTTNNTLLEPNLVWLRASVGKESRAVCRLLAVVPNAVRVTLKTPEAGAAAAHLESGLPAESITKLAEPVSSVKEVAQPYGGFGGSPRQDEFRFRRRVSERLRHRNRAVTAWDYERIVLEEFPNIYRVWCLPHTDVDLNLAPGKVTLVVIPDTRNGESFSALEPRVDLGTLSKVNDFLAGLNSPFAVVRATNAAFERIQLRFKVAFRAGRPYASYRSILIEDIKRHLSPWAYGDSLLPEFGNGLFASGLIAFIEDLEYVDYVTDFEVLHFATGATTPEVVVHAVPSRQGALLTSAATHLISDARS